VVITRLRASRQWLLPARTRKSVLLLHITSAGVWIGLDVAMAVLVFTALLTGDHSTAAVSFQALQLFAIWSLFTTGMVCLITGIILGLGSKYGLLRYWWVAVKLVLNLVLTGLVPLALAPTVADAAARGRLFTTGHEVTLQVGNLIFPPIVSPVALMIALTLSVFKPWGRIRTTR
jgi:uncharacterized membrane protein